MWLLSERKHFVTCKGITNNNNICLYFFFAGNKNIHAITSNGEYELLVVLTDFQSNTKKARYNSFSVKDASTNYQLDVSGYSGDAGW